MPFKPGQSGNRNGRPRGSAGVAAYIREQCGDDCRELIDRLLDLSRNPQISARERVGATMHLLDRAVGKPVATEIQLRADVGNQLPANWHLLTSDEQDRWLDADSHLALDSAETLTEDE